jgi:hypothetical protein
MINQSSLSMANLKRQKKLIELRMDPKEFKYLRAED